MLNLNQVCAVLNLRPRQLSVLIRQGVFTTSPTLKRNRLIPTEQVLKFVADAKANIPRRLRNETK